MSEELKLRECPFCGSTRVELSTVPSGDYHAVCTRCAASSADYYLRQDAVESWNERVTGWIPVSERLAEDGETVIFCNDRKLVGVAEMCKGKFHDIAGDEYRQIMRVIAWMPLPAAPVADLERVTKEDCAKIAEQVKRSNEWLGRKDQEV